MNHTNYEYTVFHKIIILLSKLFYLVFLINWLSMKS